MAYIKVRRSASTLEESGGIFGFTITVDVLETEGLPLELFVFLPIGTAPDDTRGTEEFQNVASLADVEEYPVGAPAEGTDRPFYRRSSVTLHFRSESLAADAWQCMESDFAFLIQAAEDAETVATSGEYTFGTKTSSSSSS
jgi:hypothetical protein